MSQPTFVTIVVKNAQTRVEVRNAAPVQVVTVAQGPSGKPGPPGPSSELQAICGTTISSGQVVVLVDGLLFPADPTNVTHAPLVAGVSTQAGQPNAQINVLAAGELTGESLTKGDRYFVGLNGSLSTSSPAPGATWAKSIGLAQDAGTLLIQMQASIIL